MKDLHKLFTYLFIYLLLPFTAVRANEIFKHLNIDNGLAHTDANCIAQDSTGLIWIGTFGGLQSYDGYTLETFDYYPQGHKIYESHNRIRAMACGKEKIWLGTESGLTCFDLDTHRYIPYDTADEKLSKQLKGTVTDLFIDPNGCHLWIRTPQEIVVVEAKGSTLTPLEWDNEADRVFCKGINIVQFQGETIWASSGWHILKLNVRNGHITLQNSYETTRLFGKGQWIRSLCLQGDYLYARSEDGCYRFSIADGQPDPATRAYINFHNAHPRIPVLTNGKLAVSKEGDLWCGYSAGIFEVQQPFSPQPVVREYLRNTQGDNQSTQKINGLLIGRYNNLWVATNSRGVFYRTLSKPLFKNLSTADFQEAGFSQNEIVSVTGQDDGTNWMIVEYGSLFRYRPHTGELTLIPLRKESPEIYYQAITMSRDQRHLYIGTSHGILVYDTRTGKLDKLQPSATNDAPKVNTSIACLTEDESGNLWAGTWGNGILRISHPLTSPAISMQLNTQTDPGLLSDLVSHILIRGESLLLCTTNGLNRLRLTADGKIKSLSSYRADAALPASMSTNYLAGIDCDNDSVCWIGTIGGGLNKVVLHSERSNDYTATAYTVQDGLPNNDCEIVLLDRRGNVWIGGNGIARLDSRTNAIQTYGSGNGLQNNAFKINVSYKSKDGALYMGGLYGLSYFYPDRITDHSGNSELMFANLYVNNRKIVPQTEYNGRVLLEKTLDKSDRLTLNHLQNNFTVSFAALGYELSGQVMFRYRLKGFQEEWRTLRHNDNKVYFTNLPYGSYKLEVQLSNDKGNTWHEPGKALGIRILPPWWLSPYAKAGYVALIAFVLFAAFRQYNKEQNLKKENEIQKILMVQDEEKYQAKMQFFMNASHELRTPLTLILLAAEKLSGGDKSAKACKTILTNARKMLSLINELVDIRKADLGIGSLKLGQLNMSQLVARLFDEISTWAENKRLAVSYTAEAEDIVLDADKEKIGKMVINLLSNAIKYTDEGGRIEVSFRKGSVKDIVPCYATTHTEGSIPPEQPVCILTVKDTGVGISTESIRLIYERFFQTEGASQSHLGSGIGLAIVKSIVLQHQGSIVVSSERMVGTEFIVALPIFHHCTETEQAAFDIEGFITNQYNELNTDELKEEKRSDGPESSNPQLPTLLLVEDNKELQAALKEQLSPAYNVLIADNGRIGLEMCLSLFPDIIVSDVMMPEMDGMEMCRRIKDNLSVAYIPLVLLTAKGNVESQIEGYESGADLYIPKPFSLKLLEVNLQRLLAQRERWFKNAAPAPQHENAAADGHDASGKEADKVSQKSALTPEEAEAMKEQLRKVIDAHLGNPALSPEQIANVMGVSRTKLYRDFKQIEQQSLSDYVRNIRLEKAAFLLVNSDLNVQEIMNEVGFTNSSHFTKVFKLKYDMPPTEYKRNH